MVFRLREPFRNPLRIAVATTVNFGAILPRMPQIVFQSPTKNLPNALTHAAIQGVPQTTAPRIHSRKSPIPLNMSLRPFLISL